VQKDWTKAPTACSYPDDLRRAIDRAAARFPDQVARVAVEWVEAESLVARLRGLPPAHRRLVVANVAAGGRRAACEILIDESRASGRHGAAEALDWAELALLAAERNAGPGAEELRARALMERASAHRIAGDLPAAWADFTVAKALLRGSGADPLVWADLHALRATLAAAGGGPREGARPAREGARPSPSAAGPLRLVGSPWLH
jgi:hypothetical protein